MTVSITQAQLTKRTLQILNAVGADGSESAEDKGLVASMIAPVLARLAQQSIIRISNQEVFDEAHYLPLAGLLALELAPDFGTTAADLANKGVTRAQCEADLRATLSDDDGGQPVPALYY